MSRASPCAMSHALQSAGGAIVMQRFAGVVSTSLFGATGLALAGLAFSGLAFSCLALGGLASAGTWPDRPVTMIVPFAAGGPTDVVGRVLAQPLGDGLEQQIVVENVGGAGGMVGAQRVALAEP